MISKITESQSTRKDDLSSNETNQLLKEMNSHLKELVEQKTRPASEQSSTPVHEQGKPSKVSVPEKDLTEQTQPKQPKLKGILKHTTGHTSISDSIKVINDGTDETIYDKIKKKRDDLVNPAWAECKELGDGKVLQLAEEELKFWKGFLHKYLEPLDLSPDQKKATAKGLIELRNNIALGMAMINLLWIAVNFMFQFQSPTSISLKVSGSSDPDSPEYLEENQEPEEESADNVVTVDVLGLLFIFFYLSILLLQFVGMMIHRWGTFQHLVSVTKLRNPFPMLDRKAKRRADEEDRRKKDVDAKEAREIIDTILKEPLPDYSDDSDAEEKFEQELRNELEVLQKTGSRYRVTVKPNGGIGASSRRLGETVSEFDRSRNFLSKSSRVIRDGIEASKRRFAKAPEGEILRRGMQYEFYKSKDKYIDRPLPPVRQKRLNLGPGRSELADRLLENNPEASRYFKDSDRDGPLVAETDPDDDIYDRIGSKGTVSRQIGKRLKLYAKTMESMEASLSNGPTRQPVVSFQNSGRPTSTHWHLQNHNHYQQQHRYHRYERY